MIKYEVNQVYPFPHPQPGLEISLSEINTAFFDVKNYLHNPTPEEIKDWRRGNLKYGFYFENNIVFFLLQLETMSLDVSINILKVKTEEQREAWLNEEGKVINIFLIDAATNILKGMRMFSIPMELAERLKDTLETQQNYEDVKIIDEKISEITNRLTTEDMISRTKMFRL